MKTIFIYRNIFLVLLAVIVMVSATLVYLFTAGHALIQQLSGSVTPAANVPYTPIAELHPSQPCSAKQRYFQMGVAFPQWSPTGYGTADTKWLTELQDMRTQTGACWVEIPILFFQSSLTSTTVMPGPSTPSVSSFNYGIHFAHAMGLHVFVTPLLQIRYPSSLKGAGLQAPT